MSSSEEPAEFTTVVDGMPFAEADAAFASWRRQHEDVSARLTMEDIRIDTIRAHDGRSLRRYRIRREVLADE